MFFCPGSHVLEFQYVQHFINIINNSCDSLEVGLMNIIPYLNRSYCALKLIIYDYGSWIDERIIVCINGS